MISRRLRKIHLTKTPHRMTEYTNCLSILAGDNTYGNVTDFAQGAGQVYLIEGAECWTDVADDIENQIAYAEIGIAALEALHYPTEAIREQIKGIEAVRNYSKGLMLVTSYQWDEADLVNGDQMGLCFYQKSGRSSENSTSCWAYDYSGNGTYSSKNSYLIKASTIGVNSQLEDYPPVDASFPTGTEGHWFLSNPENAFDTTVKVWAARFSPSSGDTSDPAIKNGSAEIVTYQASRTAPTSVAESTLAAVDHKMLQQSNSFGTNYRWQSEQITLLCYSDANCSYVPPTTGASAVTMAGTILAACVAMLSF